MTDLDSLLRAADPAARLTPPEPHPAPVGRAVRIPAARRRTRMMPAGAAQRRTVPASTSAIRLRDRAIRATAQADLLRAVRLECAAAADRAEAAAERAEAAAEQVKRSATISWRLHTSVAPHGDGSGRGSDGDFGPGADGAPSAPGVGLAFGHDTALRSKPIVADLPSTPRIRAANSWDISLDRAPWAVELRVEVDRASSAVHVTKLSARLNIPSPAGAVTTAVANALAEQIVQTTWPTITQQWIVTDPAHLAVAASGVDAASGALHDLLLTDPVASVARQVGAPDPLAHAAGVVAGQASLPGDGPAGTTALVLRLIGVAVGIASGHPVFALATMKDLTRQVATSALSRGLVAMEGVRRLPAAEPAPASPPGRNRPPAASAIVVPLASAAPPQEPPAVPPHREGEDLIKKVEAVLAAYGFDNNSLRGRWYEEQVGRTRTPPPGRPGFSPPGHP